MIWMSLAGFVRKLGIVCKQVAWILAALPILLFAAHAAAEPFQVLDPDNSYTGARRYALVIGNGAYENVSPLENTIGDARAIGAKAQKLGFRVHLVEDADRDRMHEALNAFLNGIEPGSEVLVYYAGHGVELQGSNYLFPVDVPKRNTGQERLLRSDALNLSDILGELQSRSPRVAIVILDACRDNPFAGPGVRSLGRTRGLGDVQAPTGTFVIYAAGAGETALDTLGPQDKTENGVFTRSLLKFMDQGGLELRQMTLQLRQEVRLAALSSNGHSQNPSYYDQFFGDFYFRAAPPKPVEKSLCETLVKENAGKAEILFSDYSNIVSSCERAAEQAPDNPQIPALLKIAREQQAFQSALTSDSENLARAYLQIFPQGRYTAEVEQHLAGLKEKAPVSPEISAPARTEAASEVPEPSPATPPEPSPAKPVETALLAPVPVPPQFDVKEVSRNIQQRLAQAGCYSGPQDGVWGNRSRKALTDYVRFARTTLPGAEPSPELLQAIKPGAARVCPLVCAARFVARGDQCVLKSCGSGLVLSSAGQCVRPRPRPSPPRRKPAGDNCFFFNDVKTCD